MLKKILSPKDKYLFISKNICNKKFDFLSFGSRYTFDSTNNVYVNYNK